MGKNPHEKDFVESCIRKARLAQSLVSDYTQTEINDACLAVGWQMYCDDNVRKLAELAVAETQMGRVPDKIEKQQAKVLRLLQDLIPNPSVGLIEENPFHRIRKYAKPVGVVAALTPVTNPTSTIASNALSILKGRNAVVFVPNPRAARSGSLTVHYIRQGLAEAGAPEDLVQTVEMPNMSLSRSIMSSVDLIVATGGRGMVRAAHSCGKPAYGVGPGNAVQLIAEDADVKDAVSRIVDSCCFDNSTSCSSESAVIIDKAIWQGVLDQLEKEGGHLLSIEERARLADWMWTPNRRGVNTINPDAMGKSATFLAESCGIPVPSDTRLLLVRGLENIAMDQFAAEKLAPVLTLYSYQGFRQAVQLVNGLLEKAGTGHSCGIHTFDEDFVDHLASTIPVSRIMVRQGQAKSNGGSFTNGMPSSLTLGCGTWGGNITTENINYRHFLNVTWVSEPLEGKRPTAGEIWGEYWSRRERHTPSLSLPEMDGEIALGGSNRRSAI